MLEINARQLIKQLKDEQRTKVKYLHVSQHSSNEMLSAALSVDECNILIAKFIGLKDLNKEQSTFLQTPEMLLVNTDGQYISKTALKYHKSWDWLMSAVNKFINETIRPSESRDRNEYSKYCNELHNLVTDFNIVPVFNRLAKAIEWHRNVVSVGSR